MIFRFLEEKRKFEELGGGFIVYCIGGIRQANAAELNPPDSSLPGNLSLRTLYFKTPKENFEGRL